MTCRRAQSLIEDLVDNELSEARAAEVKAMLAENPDCLQEYELSGRLKQLLSELSQRANPNPGDEYFTELQRLIMARTVETTGYVRESADSSGIGLPARETARSSVRASFVRSIVTVAASLCVFVTAVFLGSTDPSGMARDRQSPADVSSASIVHLVNADADLELTSGDRDKIVAGVMLLGPPGLLGRFTDMAGEPQLE